MELSVKLDAFEGPLDLLLHLIEKNRVSICDIPIAEITDQYMEYVKTIQEEDLEGMSEFLLMAATLLDIKAKTLLPAPSEPKEESGDPRAELVQRLLEYKLVKILSEQLRRREAGSERIVPHAAALPEAVRNASPPADLERLLKGVDTETLRRVYEDVRKRQEARYDPELGRFGEIEREAVKLDDRLDYVLASVRREGRRSFRSLFDSRASRAEVIVTFLAVLELILSGDIRLTEDSTRDDFTLEYGGQTNENTAGTICGVR